MRKKKKSIYSAWKWNRDLSAVKDNLSENNGHFTEFLFCSMVSMKLYGETTCDKVDELQNIFILWHVKATHDYIYIIK